MPQTAVAYSSKGLDTRSSTSGLKATHEVGYCYQITEFGYRHTALHAQQCSTARPALPAGCSRLNHSSVCLQVKPPCSLSLLCPTQTKTSPERRLGTRKEGMKTAASSKLQPACCARGCAALCCAMNPNIQVLAAMQSHFLCTSNTLPPTPTRGAQQSTLAFHCSMPGCHAILKMIQKYSHQQTSAADW